MIAVRTRIAADVKPVLADEALLHQLLLNLGTNAAHAIGDRPGEIRISLALPDREEVIANNMNPDACVCLAVGDTGSGMDAATLERIFDPFFTTRSHAGGTGLGLSVVQGIVASHGGKVLVHSEAGAGTTFRILLPGAIVPVAQRAEAALVTSARREGAGHIVIVDDEKPLIILMQWILEKQGFRVTAFSDPRQALESLRATGGNVDVLVTDMSMPTMSGFHLVEAVREILPALPIVVATGYLRQEDIDAGHSLGVSRFVLKPEQFEQIGTILVELLTAPADR